LHLTPRFYAVLITRSETIRSLATTIFLPYNRLALEAYWRSVFSLASEKMVSKYSLIRRVRTFCRSESGLGLFVVIISQLGAERIVSFVQLVFGFLRPEPHLNIVRQRHTSGVSCFHRNYKFLSISFDFYRFFRIIGSSTSMGSSFHRRSGKKSFGNKIDPLKSDDNQM